MNDDIIDYAAQEAPFEKWKKIKQAMNKAIRKKDPKPTDPLDELERVREEGRVWVLEHKNDNR